MKTRASSGLWRSVMSVVDLVEAKAFRCRLYVYILTIALTSSVSLGVTIVQSTIYERTLWAETAAINGTPIGFTGIPVPSMLGADSADIILDDVTLLAGGEVTVDIQLLLLNEESTAPADLGGFLYDFVITLDPDPMNPSLGTMTIFWDGSEGPGQVGTVTRAQQINFITTFTAINGGAPIGPVAASINTISAEPIPFSFTPESTVVLKTGIVGDTTANFHTDLELDERNFFTLPSLGAFVLMEPEAFQARESVNGGGRAMMTQPIAGDECPLDLCKTDPGLTGCGNHDDDDDGNGRPDFYDRFVMERPVPTVSEWGLVVLTLLGLATGTIFYGRRRVVNS